MTPKKPAENETSETQQNEAAVCGHEPTKQARILAFPSRSQSQVYPHKRRVPLPAPSDEGIGRDKLESMLDDAIELAAATQSHIDRLTRLLAKVGD